MKILIADHFGMCFGVRDAIVQAESLAAAGPLTILGELVHNPVVRERLRALGVSEVSLDSVDCAASNEVMITAHGVADGRREALTAAGYKVADGTCPLVRNAHTRLGELVAAGYLPIVIGQVGHVEVRGLTEDFPGAVVIDDEADISQLPKGARLGIISRTTQPIERVLALVAAIRAAGPTSEVRFVDTVCRPTKDRQEALQRLIAKTDLVVVVGGRSSNNTRQLVERCRAADRRVVHIERAEELNAPDFIDVAVVGVTAGTSTLSETVDAVVAGLHAISNNQTKAKS
jgi:4-hydroxy-3-methylbut-2-enyl diphosphate reductase